MSKDTIDKNGFLTSAGIDRRISPCLSPEGNNHLLGVTDDGQVIGFNVDGQKANRNVLVVGQNRQSCSLVVRLLSMVSTVNILSATVV